MNGEQLLIKRMIAHPREVVFAAWTDARQLVKWFAPRGCTLIAPKLDIREGGSFHWCVKNPDYPDCWCTGEFLRIKTPSQIQYTIRLADDKGKPVTADQAMKAGNWPDETLVTVDFYDEGSHTRLEVRQSVVEAIAKSTGAYKGWLETLDVLEEQLTNSKSQFK